MTNFTLFQTNYTPASLRGPLVFKTRRRLVTPLFVGLVGAWFLLAFVGAVAFFGA